MNTNSLTGSSKSGTSKRDSSNSSHQDSLRAINLAIPLKDKIISTHAAVQTVFPFIARIAIALYDTKSGELKTFVHSSGGDNPLPNYQANLEQAPSLKAIVEAGFARVINDMSEMVEGQQQHTQKLAEQGYAASYTMPIFHHGVFKGFIFFSSYQSDVFTEYVLKQLDVYGHMISLLVMSEIHAVNTFSAAVKTTGGITHIRDPETGSHLDRMSRYSRIIACELAEKYQLSDDFIEHIFMFAPLHDIGKIGIPDEILLKRGKLTEQERKVMQTHAGKGRQIIDDFLKNFGFEKFDYAGMLRNIAECHHEALDGSGYPNGLKGEAIPIEARIVAVADIFDALTSERPYKSAWSNDKAIELLQKMAGDVLDIDCVDALVNNLYQVELIQATFCEGL